MTVIVQNSLPPEMQAEAGLPGMAPAAPHDWLRVDEAYGAQMQRRLTLLTGARDAVLWVDPTALDAAREVLAEALTVLPDLGFTVEGQEVICPDGRVVVIDNEEPLLTLGRLVQEDICLLRKQGAEHVLVGAVLCFPASWTLSEKIGRPLSAIHIPIPEYDADITRRVQRLFDAIRPEQPMWRANAILHHDPALFHPQSEQSPHATRQSGQAGTYLRSERQTLRRLPVTGAVVFTIHTYMIPVERLSDEQRAGLATADLKSA